MKYKKGNAIIDTLLFIVLIFIVATVWLTIGYIQNELNTEIQADTELNTQGKQINQDLTTSYPGIMDSAILFFLILFWVLVLVASYMIDTHPAFFIVSFILLLFVFSVVVYIGNAFNEIFTQDLTGLAPSYPYTFFIFNNILPITIIIGFSILIVLFAKPR